MRGRWAAGPPVVAVSHASDLERTLLWLTPGLVHVCTLPLTSCMGPGASDFPSPSLSMWWVQGSVQGYNELSSEKLGTILAGNRLTGSMGDGSLPERLVPHHVMGSAACTQ